VVVACAAGDRSALGSDYHQADELVRVFVLPDCWRS